MISVRPGHRDPTHMYHQATRSLPKLYSLCQEFPGLCSKIVFIPQNSIPSTSSLETFVLIRNIFLAPQAGHPQLLPFRYLRSSSQMLRREAGSTPAVGSSKITTWEPPTKAMATESFRFIPPGQGEGPGCQHDTHSPSAGQGCLPFPHSFPHPPGPQSLASSGSPGFPLASHYPWDKVPAPSPASSANVEAPP